MRNVYNKLEGDKRRGIMNNQAVEKIILSGEDSIKFANSLFRPSSASIKRNRDIFGSIDQNIVIRKIDDGFEAEIGDLDLSFLDGLSEGRGVSDEFIFSVEISSGRICVNTNERGGKVSREINGFVSSDQSAYFTSAGQVQSLNRKPLFPKFDNTVVLSCAS
jgi:hypothetical protein